MDGRSEIANAQSSNAEGRVAPVGKLKHETGSSSRAVDVSGPSQFGSSGGHDNNAKGSGAKRPQQANGGDAKMSQKEAARIAFLARQAKRDARKANANLIQMVKEVREVGKTAPKITRHGLALVLKEIIDSNKIINDGLPKNQRIVVNTSTINLRKIYEDLHPPVNLKAIIDEARKNPGKRHEHIVLPGDRCYGPTNPNPSVGVQAVETPSAAPPKQPVGPSKPIVQQTPTIKQSGHVIWRKSPWWRRLIFKEVPSRLEISRPDNLHIGTLQAHKHCTDRLTTNQDLAIPELYSYLLMNKFSKYNDRQECLDHMEKLARKYWKDECKRDFGKMDALTVNRHYITIQKAVDEKTTAYLLTEERQEITRKQRFAHLPWKRTTKTTSPPWAPFHQIPQ